MTRLSVYDPFAEVFPELPDKLVVNRLVDGDGHLGRTRDAAG